MKDRNFVEDDIDGVIIDDIDDVGLGTLQSRLKVHSLLCLGCFEASLGFDTESVDRESACGEKVSSWIACMSRLLSMVIFCVTRRLRSDVGE